MTFSSEDEVEDGDYYVKETKISIKGSDIGSVVREPEDIAEEMSDVEPPGDGIVRRLVGNQQQPPPHLHTVHTVSFKASGTIRAFIRRVKTLHLVLKSEMGRQLTRSAKSRFFRIKGIQACFHDRRKLAKVMASLFSIPSSR